MVGQTSNLGSQQNIYIFELHVTYFLNLNFTNKSAPKHAHRRQTTKVCAEGIKC